MSRITADLNAELDALEADLANNSLEGKVIALLRPVVQRMTPENAHDYVLARVLLATLDTHRTAMMQHDSAVKMAARE